MAIQVKVNAVSGSATDNVDLSDQAFGAEFNEALIHQVVTAYQAGGRSGTRAETARARADRDLRHRELHALW